MDDRGVIMFASHEAFQIVKILHSNTVFRCFKKIVLFCRAHFTI